jgi:hypothetical protein
MVNEAFAASWGAEGEEDQEDAGPLPGPDPSSDWRD